MFLDKSVLPLYAFYHQTYIEFIEGDFVAGTILASFDMTVASLKEEIAEQLDMEAPPGEEACQ